jgi:hypothetical protein
MSAAHPMAAQLVELFSRLALRIISCTASSPSFPSSRRRNLKVWPWALARSATTPRARVEKTGTRGKSYLSRMRLREMPFRIHFDGVANHVLMCLVLFVASRAHFQGQTFFLRDPSRGPSGVRWSRKSCLVYCPFLKHCSNQ